MNSFFKFTLLAKAFSRNSFAVPIESDPSISSLISYSNPSVFPIATDLIISE